MKSFFDYVSERGIEIPKGNIPGDWFSKHGYPMVVRCSCCEMTMAIPSAWIDEEGYTYCADCAGINDPDYECDGQCILCSKGDECPCSNNY